jgi:hypothetical protein
MASQQRNKTLKRPHDDGTLPVNASDMLRDFLDSEAENAYNRPWHRLERGFRLNRLRKFAEAEAAKTQLSPPEVQQLLLVLTKALDRRLLNTKTTVIYEQELAEIKEIKGLIMHRQADGKMTFQMLEKKATTMRKRSAPTSVKVEQPTATTQTSPPTTQ